MQTNTLLFAKAGKAIVKMNEETASLEDVFLELTSSEKPRKPMPFPAGFAVAAE